MRAKSAQLCGRLQSSRGVLAVIAAALLTGACSAGGALDTLDGMLGSQQTASLGNSSDGSMSENAGSKKAGAKTGAKSELDKAIEHWGEQHKQKPADLKIALAYARNLKAAGHKEQAFGVLQGASLLHGDSAELASEYGRLALEFDQIAVAEKLLGMAEDPTKPDWKLTSARGTVLAKQGKFADAIPFYERALSISPGQPSVLNNLAMAHAASGQPAKAEEILRKTLATSGDPKLRQNLAIVLGLQGRHDEAKALASAFQSPDVAAANVEYVRAMVKPGAAVVAVPAVLTQPAKPARGQGAARVIEAKNTPSNGMRPSGGPTDVGSSGGWSTTVSRTQ